jgi:hypothetical protein
MSHPKRFYFALCVLSGGLLFPGQHPAQVQPQNRVNPDSQLIQDFETHVTEYVKLHKTVEAKLPPLKLTASPEVIANHQHDLASRIREERKQARQGDIFTAKISGEFHRLIGMVMGGPEAGRIKTSLKAAEPVRLQLHVNDEYPAGVPLQSMPPTLLQNLPRLPAEVEYRIVGDSLILRDVKANLIVDFIPQAIP